MSVGGKAVQRKKSFWGNEGALGGLEAAHEQRKMILKMSKKRSKAYRIEFKRLMEESEEYYSALMVERIGDDGTSGKKAGLRVILRSRRVEPEDSGSEMGFADADEPK